MAAYVVPIDVTVAAYVVPIDVAYGVRLKELNSLYKGSKIKLQQVC